MKKLFFVLFMAVSATMVAQQTADMNKYLNKDAVPVVDGKVVFSDKIDILEGYSAEQVGAIATKWLEDLLAGFESPKNRIVLNKDNRIAATGYAEVIFTDNAISLDRAFMNCVLIVNYSANECSVSVERIKYDYNNSGKSETYLAEDYITYENSVNKKGTKLSAITGKFRRGTIDKKDEIFKSFREAFKYYSRQGKYPPAFNSQIILRLYY